MGETVRRRSCLVLPPMEREESQTCDTTILRFYQRKGDGPEPPQSVRDKDRCAELLELDGADKGKD